MTKHEMIRRRMEHQGVSQRGSLVQPADSDGGVSRALVKPVLIVWAVVFLWLCVTRVYNHDEFEGLHQGWLLFVGQVQYVDFSSNHPPVLFQLLRLLHYLSDDPLVLLHLGRTISVVAAAATMVFIYRIGRSIFNEAAACWAILAFATNATLWEWMVDIRTDMLLVPTWLAAISLAVDARRPNAWRAILVGLLMGTAFWINQKAVLHAAPLGLFMVLGGLSGQWKFKDWALSALASLIPAAVVIMHAVSVGSFGSLVENLFLGGAEMALADPFVRARNETLVHVILHDFGMVFLATLAYIGLAYVGLFKSQIVEKPRGLWFLLLGSLWMMATFFWTPGPFGYYMLSILPLTVFLHAYWTRYPRMRSAFVSWRERIFPQSPAAIRSGLEPASTSLAD